MRCCFKLLLVFLFCNTIQQLKAQTDTAFWFVAPDVTFNNGSTHGDRPIYLRFTALNQDAVVTISQPANASFALIIVTVPANTSQTVDLTARIDMVENKPANQVLNYGLLIRSTAFITAYYEEASVNNPEIFALKGRNALGINFFIPAQNMLNNSGSTNPAAVSAFDIVATEDATIVTITPTQNIIGYAANVPFTITLNKGQTFSAVASSNLTNGHLMGSTVTANKPVAITIKDDSIGGGAFGSCSDMAGEQIVPVSLVGKRYISLPGYLNTPSGRPSDNLFILATEDNTTININGNNVSTINKGQTFMQQSYNDIFYIETTKPVYVLHLSGFGCEVGHALLPQLDCSGSRTVGFTRSISSPLYVNILVPTGGENGFTFNGDNTTINAAQFSNVPFSNGAWKYARIQLSTGQMAAGATAIVKNNAKDFHLSIIHGDAATGCRYGYFSGFNRLDAVGLSNATAVTPGCVGDTLKLYCDIGAAEGIQFSWTGPNGFTSNEQNPIVLNMQINMAGTYAVTVTKPGCNTVNATVSVIINTKPSVSISPVNPVCEKAFISLNSSLAGIGATYSWTGPNGFSSSSPTNTLNNITLLAAGSYFLVTNNGGCKDYDTVVVIVKPTPLAQLVSSFPVCRFTSATINNNNTITPATYTWSSANGFSNNQQNISFNSFNYSDTGKYYLTVTVNGCSAIDSIVASLKEIPNIQFLSLNNVCFNDAAFQLNALETTGIAGTATYTGNGLTSAGLFTPATAGVGNHNLTYTYTANNGCVADKQQNINVFESPVVDAGNNKAIIQQASTILNGTITGNAAILKWTPNYFLNSDTILNPVAQPLQTTTYKLEVISANGCYAFDTVNIKVIPNIVIPNAFSPNGDGINETWSIPALAALSNCVVEIFDRSGRQIFRSRGYTIDWDGKFNGKPLPSGTYYYIIQTNDGYLTEPFTGSVTIFR
jgi:gliding motility-associated-like protein